MSVPSIAPAAPATSRAGRVPSTPARDLSAVDATTWDPLLFRAAARQSTNDAAPLDPQKQQQQQRDEPSQQRDQPRLVWSNGRARTLPDPDTWCATVARACTEALHGSRPATQLHRMLDAEVYSALQRRAHLAARMRTRGVRANPVRVRRVHPCQIGPGIWEASVVLQDGGRVRAAAIRIEAHRGHWRATAVQIA